MNSHVYNNVSVKLTKKLKPFFNNCNVLITGGLGFIGSHLARCLHELGANVLLVDNLKPEYGGNKYNVESFSNAVKVRIADVRDVDMMRSLVEKQEYLFNLAGQTSHIDSMTDPYTDLDINAHAQLCILEECRKHNPGIKIVYASTRQIYGKPIYFPVDEKHPVNPVDVNGINKLAGEQYHLLYNSVYGIRTCCLRLTNTYGPHMRIKDARQTFLGIWIKYLLQGEDFEVWDGQQKRDMIYVSDAVVAFLLAACSPEAYGKTFNVGGPEVHTLKDIARQLVEANGNGSFKVKEFPKERKAIDIGDYYSDSGYLHGTLGWKPHVQLDKGLRETVDYFKEHLEAYL